MEFLLIHGFMLQALDKCRESPPDDWPAPAYVLVGREDLSTAKMGSVRKENGFSNNDSSTSISVPTTASDAPTSEVLNSEDTDAVYRSVEDGMEHIFTSTTQLRYGRDLRLNEVCSVFTFLVSRSLLFTVEQISSSCSCSDVFNA
jgi:anaphase-promoting complex subunit 1